ncbi:unnamed protein product [Paramecium sonneborni]|uniref:Uncharacterized protein n=1 Tax=Paramecium sonneborni TaxID=65129 RepID=A0A8S1RUF8_9CILI|nr:unnamed protein product [Paramecium sonneborni]
MIVQNSRLEQVLSANQDKRKIIFKLLQQALEKQSQLFQILNQEKLIFIQMEIIIKKKTLPIEKNAAQVPLVQFAAHGKVAALNPLAQHPNLNYPRTSQFIYIKK